MPEENPFVKGDSSYLEFKKTHPEVSFAEFYHINQVPKLRKGAAHATLGTNLENGEDWSKAGLPMYRLYSKLFPFQPSTRVLEYGCGSLRVGVHFIKHLNPGCYFGLDVTTGFIEIGKETIGDELLSTKAPQLAAISEDSLGLAEAFSAQFVFACNVAFHVHPSEHQPFVDNLLRLTKSRGTILVFDTKIAAEHFRYSSTCWAWPLDFYLEKFRDLTFLNTNKTGEKVVQDRKMDVVHLAFRRD